MRTKDSKSAEKPNSVFLKSLKLDGLLSFPQGSPALELGPLNVLIGPNGSGKSNFIDGIDFLRSAPRDMDLVIREGGGVVEWLHKPAASAIAKVAAQVSYLQGTIEHEIVFRPLGARFQLDLESIVSGKGLHPPSFHYNRYGQQLRIERNDIPQPVQTASDRLGESGSVLSFLRDPKQYPELWHLTSSYEQIRIYQDWSFGPGSPVRRPQRASEPNAFLLESLENLGLILNRFRLLPDVRDVLIGKLADLAQGFSNFEVQTEANTVQVFLQEGRHLFPSVRLSDGTLRYLCLLAILLHPDPPPLVCIEEPELGLHPDILPGLADLLVEASQRMQLIVTTHSDILVDALSETPESVVVCEKVEGTTEMKRLDPKELKPWLKSYRLGQLWTKGTIGGTRW